MIAMLEATTLVNNGALAWSLNKIGFGTRIAAWAGAAGTAVADVASKFFAAIGALQALYSAGTTYKQQVNQGKCGTP